MSICTKVPCCRNKSFLVNINQFPKILICEHRVLILELALDVELICV